MRIYSVALEFISGLPQKVSFFDNARKASWIHFHNKIFEFSRQKSTVESSSHFKTLCGSEEYEFIEFEILISESMQRKVMWNNQLYEVYLKEDMRGRFWYWNWKMSLAGRIFCHVSNKNDKKRNENEGCVPTYKKSHFTTLRAECVIFSCQIYLNFRAKMSEFVIL